MAKPYLIEYAGRIGDPSYAAGMAHKEAVYRENGLAAVIVTPDWLKGDWPRRILGNIEDILTDRLAGFRASRERAIRAGTFDRQTPSSSLR